MSVVNRHNHKVLLPRTGPDLFWTLIAEHYAGENELRWRYLAMLSLREIAGWSQERIALAFGNNRGHVCRCLQKIKRELQTRFGLSTHAFDEDETDDEFLAEDTTSSGQADQKN